MMTTTTTPPPLLILLVLLLPALLPATARAGYTLDPAWPAAPGWPANASRFTAAAVVGDTVYVAQRSAAYPAPLLLYSARTGQPAGHAGRSLVANGGAAAGYGVHGLNVAVATGSSAGVLWLTDVLNHTVVLAGIAPGNPANVTRGAVVGTPGTAGSGVAPLQFGSVADVDFDLARGWVFVSDGDGGINSRVLGLTWAGTAGAAPQLQWAAGTNGTARGQYNSPHSLTFHPGSGTVLVADRGNARIVQVAAATGHVIDIWDMQPHHPWGVRYVAQPNAIVMADGDNQALLVLDARGISSSGLGSLKILQSIAVNKTVCDTPHELGVDHATGDVYLACVNDPGSNMQKYVWSQ